MKKCKICGNAPTGCSHSAGNNGTKQEPVHYLGCTCAKCKKAYEKAIDEANREQKEMAKGNWHKRTAKEWVDRPLPKLHKVSADEVIERKPTWEEEAHLTADDWCCACEADIAFMNQKI